MFYFFFYDDKITTSGAITGNNNPELYQFYCHFDHLGNTSLITNLDGEIVQHIEYVPFGEVFIEERNNKWNTPFLFNAKELDEETGLYYYGARYYDPRTSVWLSVDPIATYNPFEQENFIDGQHNGGVYNSFNHTIYGYCYQNPIKLTDPNGKQVDPLFNMSPDQWNSYANSTKVQDIQLKVAQKSAESMLQTADKVAYYAMPMVSYADAADAAWARGDYFDYGVNIVAGTLDGLLWICTIGQSSWAKGGIGGVKVATSTTRTAIRGLSQEAAQYASKSVRADHAMRHLIDQGVISGTKNSNLARKGWDSLVENVLTSPTKTFDYVLQGAQTTGYYKMVGGQDVVLFVAKQDVGSVKAGQVLGGWVPSIAENADIMRIINP